jgi:hypothetical protein
MATATLSVRISGHNDDAPSVQKAEVATYGEAAISAAQVAEIAGFTLEDLALVADGESVNANDPIDPDAEVLTVAPQPSLG